MYKLLKFMLCPNGWLAHEAGAAAFLDMGEPCGEVSSTLYVLGGG